MRSWNNITLGEVLPFKYGKNLPAAKRAHSGEYDVVSSAGIIDSHDTAFTTEPCIVIGRKGSIGSLTYCPDPVWPTDTTFYVTGTPYCDLRFGYYVLQTLPLNQMNNDSAVPGLNRNDAESLTFFLPPVSEQKAIVKILGSLDDKIAVNNKIIKIISELLKKYWRYLCNNSSEWIELGNIITFSPQTSKPSKNACPFLEMKNLPEHGLNAQNWEIKERRSGTKFMNGDVLLARITPCFENGKIGIVDFLKEGEVGMGSTEYIVMRTKSALPPAAIYCIATSPEFRSYAAQSMTGSSGRQRVQVAPLQKFKVPNLKPTILKEFNSFSQSLLAISKIHRDENQTLARTRDELLPLLMNGKITVRDAEEASAEVGVDKHEVEE